MREEPRDAADRAGLALEIEHRDVALGRRVELEDVRDPEPLLEMLPHVGPQAVAAGKAQPMRGLARMRRRVHQITAQFADVLEDGAVPARDVVPEFARGEFLPDHRGAAVDQDRAGRDHAADRVIHGQTIVQPVARLGVHDAGEAVAREHQPVVIDVGGLGHAGGARGVDVERAVLDGEGAPLARRQRGAGVGLDLLIDARQVGAVGAVLPDPGVDGEMRPRGREGGRKLGRHDHVLGLDHVDAMGECGAREVGVDERDHAARAGEPEPDRHELRPVRHHQAHGVALGEPVRERPARVAV